MNFTDKLVSYPSVNAEINIYLAYTERITMKKIY